MADSLTPLQRIVLPWYVQRAVKRMLMEQRQQAERAQYDRKIGILARGAACDLVRRKMSVLPWLTNWKAVLNALALMADKQNQQGEYSTGRSDVLSVYYSLRSLLQVYRISGEVPNEKN